MSYSRRSRYSESPSPYRRYSRSVSRSMSRSRSRSSDSSDADNPGNNLYVTGLSARVTKRDLEKHFSTEGKVEDVHLVVDPWTRESRWFGFVTMSTLGEADRCIKYLDQSVLGGRVITVEKARRRRGRTPTPGRYLGLKSSHARGRSSSYSHSRGRSPSYSPYMRRRSLSRSRSRSYSPYHGRCRSYSRSPSYKHRRHSQSRSRPPSYSRSPVRRHSGAYSPYYSNYDRYYRRRYRSSYRDYSPDDYRRRDYSPDYRRGSRYRSRSRSLSYRRQDYSPDDGYYRRGSRYRSRSRSLSNSRSVSPCPKKSVSKRCPSPYNSRSSRSHSRSPSESSSSSQ